MGRLGDGAEGFLFFNAQNHLMLAHSRGPGLKRVLLSMQCDLLGVGGSGWLSGEAEGPQSSGFEEEEDSASAASSRHSALHLSTLTQGFLPLVVLYRAKAAFDQDPFTAIKGPRGLSLHFQPFPNQALIVYLSQRTQQPSALYLPAVAEILAFSLGPHTLDLRNELASLLFSSSQQSSLLYSFLRYIWQPILTHLLGSLDDEDDLSEGSRWNWAGLNCAPAIGLRDRSIEFTISGSASDSTSDVLRADGVAANVGR